MKNILFVLQLSNLYNVLINNTHSLCFSKIAKLAYKNLHEIAQSFFLTERNVINLMFA